MDSCRNVWKQHRDHSHRQAQAQAQAGERTETADVSQNSFPLANKERQTGGREGDERELGHETKVQERQDKSADNNVKGKRCVSPQRRITQQYGAAE